MLPDRYETFLVFAVVLVLAPGPDFAVVLKNVLANGKRGGLLASVGVVSSNLVHGTLAAYGLSALVVRSQALFGSIRWIGVGYLLYLGGQALWSAWRGRAPEELGESEGERVRGRRSWGQGFLSNITNPKVLIFYVSVLPQFMSATGPPVQGFVLAYTHALLSLAWLSLVVVGLERIGSWLRRRAVRRALEATTGAALLGFGAMLAVEAS